MAGKKNLDRELDKGFMEVFEGFKAATRQRGKVLKAMAQDKAPVDTGKLRDSAMMRARKSTRGERVNVGFGAEYADKVHKRNPFLQEAVDEFTGDHLEEMKDKTWDNYLAKLTARSVSVK